MPEFEWDDNKAASNLAKHGVSFEEAATAFDDVWARLMPDPDHSDEEERFILLGMSIKARELVVCHCLRGEDRSVVRIISARRATANEERQYWRYIHA